MAVKVDDSVNLPKSTGAVKTPDKPLEYEQDVDNSSTGAVSYDEAGLLGETATSVHGADAEVRVATPTEPVTMSVSWLSDAEAKVIQPEAKKPAKKAAAKVTTKK